MERTVIRTAAAPAAIGPYSQAVKAGGLLFCSGQIALDPATGELVAGGIEAEARRVLENLKAVVEEAGGTLASVVRTTIHLVDLADFARVNEIYGEYFAAPHPSRVTIGVASLPRGGRIEIDATAVLD